MAQGIPRDQSLSLVHGVGAGIVESARRCSSEAIARLQTLRLEALVEQSSQGGQSP